MAPNFRSSKSNFGRGDVSSNSLSGIYILTGPPSSSKRDDGGSSKSGGLTSLEMWNGATSSSAIFSTTEPICSAISSISISRAETGGIAFVCWS